jgi:hypothetical protein
MPSGARLNGLQISLFETAFIHPLLVAAQRSESAVSILAITSGIVLRVGKVDRGNKSRLFPNQECALAGIMAAWRANLTFLRGIPAFLHRLDPD